MGEKEILCHINDFKNNFLTPYHIIDLEQLKNNLEILSRLKQKANCKILYAIKCYSNYLLFPYIRQFLDGVCASGLFEARLSKEHFKKEVHTFSPAFNNTNIHDISKYSDYITFNSVCQWNRLRNVPISYGRRIGLRINPNYSEVSRFNINPCHEHSRFGVSELNLNEIDTSQLDFLLMHNMCGQYSDTLERSISVLTDKFDKHLKSIKFMNLGGGQLFTSDSYDLDKTVTCVNNLHDRYEFDIYFEPGEAVILNIGYLVATVTDIVDNGICTAILDASALCHMPDTIYSKYRCTVIGGGLPQENSYTYRLAGSTCYAGDIFGEYSFTEPIEIGSKIIFCDSLNYTIVKSSMFNGIPFPSVVLYSYKEGYQLMKEYGYDTFLSAL